MESTISDAEKRASTPAPPPCRVWGFWWTTAFTVLCLIVWAAAQIVVAMALYRWLGEGTAPRSQLGPDSLYALAIALATIISAPPALAVLMFAIRRAGCRVADYLALKWPTSRALVEGVILVLLLGTLGDVTSYLSGHDIVPEAVVDAYRTARASGDLLILGIAAVVAAPLIEELIFRGFMFPGYAASRLGVMGAILVSSAVWASMHIQYEAFYIGQIAVLGCLLGWLRWRSGSTLLTIALHALVNLIAIVQVAYLVERAT